MRPLGLVAFLIWALSCPVRAGQVEVILPSEARPGAGAAPSAAALGAAPAPIALSVPSLSASALPAAPVAAAPSAASVAAALAAPVAAPAPLPVSAVQAAVQHQIEAEASPVAAESETQAGRALFDSGAPAKKGGLLSAISAWLPIGDKIPSWPGRAGEKVRLGGRTLTLDHPRGDGGGSRVWKTSQRDWVVKILHPQFRSLPHYADEAGILRSIENSDIPHAKLIAASPDGSVMVKEFIEGAGAGELLGRGFTDLNKEGWSELAAKLIHAGVTADLAPGNLVWQHWRTRWTIVDAGGIAPGGAAAVLDQLMTPAAQAAGVDPAAFLSGLRGRLGPDSPEWGKTLAALRASPRHAAALSALDARDRARPAPPKVSFSPAATPAAFQDRKGTAAEAVMDIGYDPLFAKTRRMLHMDDPGKLNTQIFAVEPPGKTPVVVKVAEWRIIRNELALRRVVRRFFGKYFDVPSAAGVERGFDSYLVMELKPGRPNHYQSMLSAEQRAALAVLAHAFGLSDMNPGNLLFPTNGLPVLLDFEQALSRSRPVASRMPDEGIALEMPWVDRFQLNRIEDYQPAIREWHRVFSEPKARAALREDFVAAGFPPAEAESLLAVVAENTKDLDWAVQNDIDFVNHFAERSSRR